MSLEHNLGELILNLSKRVTYVRIQASDSVIDQEVYYIQIVIMLKGKAYEHKEALTMQKIADIVDVAVIADALVERVHQKHSLPRGGSKR